VPSVALGTSGHSLLEMTRAYAAVAANVATVEPYGVRLVKTRGQQLLYAHRTETAQRPAWRRAEMMDLLQSNIRYGTGKGAYYGRPAAGKTGTTQDYRDAWFIGFTADVIVGVWVGNDDNSAMNKVTGGSLPAAMWRDFMQTADTRKSSAAR
jgi:membrane peptidoglycan carboxypeptidase